MYSEEDTDRFQVTEECSGAGKFPTEDPSTKDEEEKVSENPKEDSPTSRWRFQRGGQVERQAASEC